MDINIISSLSVIGVCLSILGFFFLLTTEDLKKRSWVKYLLYAIISISLYLAITMFYQSATLTKIDIIDTIENTEKYNGFYNTTYLLIVTLIGGLVGYVYYELDKIIKNYNMQKKKW